MDAVTIERERQRSALDRLVLPRFAGRDSSGPFVAAVEGPNGAGKTTLCHCLSQKLGAPCLLGIDEAWFAEPFKVRMIRDAEWYASAMFFLSGCFERMRRLGGIAAPLIILDRSVWSTLAVHAAECPERLEAVIAMLRPVAERVRVPDLTLVLEASYATCRGRIANKSGRARALDDLTGSPAFHAREQEFYRWLGRQAAGVVFLNVDDWTAEQVAEMAAAIVRDKTRC